jgi:RNA polymerase sigma-70 factor (ECF subfamily)
MRSKARHEFERAALPYLADLYVVALRYTRHPDDAQDLVQETYMRAYAAWDRFVPGSNCRAWLLKILTNGFINTYRRGRSRRAFTQRGDDEQVAVFYGEDNRDDARDPEGAMLTDSLGDEVTAALGELPDEYRVVVVLADIEGLKYKDIAAALDCPIGTVMSRLFRARRLLEQRLSPYAAQDYGIVRRAA